MRAHQLSKVLLASSFIIVAGCAVGPKDRTGESVKMDGEISSLDPENIQPAIEDIQNEYGKVETVINKNVLKWMNYYRGRGRRHMRRYLERSTKYLDLMQEVLREEGVPEDLVYLPIVESGFSSTAHSYASAVGYWQFIRGTGKRYGLRIDAYVDERRDPVESTRAAARYLKALYNLFGDWYLSLAAYNTGENRVKRAVMKYNTRDYWKLAQRRRLPRETRNYVPKYLAAMIIAKNPKEYGFFDIDYQDRLEFDSIPVFKPISLEKLANNIGFKYKDIKSLNMMYRSDYVPVESGKSVYIKVPKGYAQRAVAALDLSHSLAPKYVPNDIYTYRVRRGDTLSGIAYKNRTTVSTLRRLNSLGRRSFIRVGQRLKVPNRGNETLRKHHNRVARAEVSSSASGEFHTVRRGENLSVIAKRYGTSVSMLKRWNQLGRRSMIKVGQKLKVREEKREPTNSGSSSRQNKKYHVVRNGENLSLIANKYGVSVGKLKHWNNLSRRAIIHKGDRIRLMPDNRVHVVRPGENLSLIAQKYEVSVSDITRANSIRNKSRIYVGKRIVIPD